MVQRRKNFKEVFDYRRCLLLRKEGLFIPGRSALKLSLDGLSEDIYVYYIQKDPRTGEYSSFSNRPLRDSAGICFLKTAFSFQKNQKRRSLNGQNEFFVQDSIVQEEEFFDFFGVRLSLDKQIALADESRFILKENTTSNQGSDSEIGEEMDNKECRVATDTPANSEVQNQGISKPV